jgi:dUTP pyrophosphatase
MRVQSLHINHIMPTKGSEQAGAYDIYMPEAGSIPYNGVIKVGLGFAAAVPVGNVAIVAPRSGIGSKIGVELNNTFGVIDSDYRGQWFATLRTKDGLPYSWNQGDRVLQFLIVPITQVTLEAVDTLDETTRGIGGLGSSGK